ncbi:MAG: hypothetical protein KIT83_00725 [Bryobacterales bacterium]|nr:hypothetical protein [Bryobacterales bacterium]
MTYEYKCDECGAGIEVRASMAEKERGLNVECPACGSARLTQVFRTLNVINGNRSSSPSSSPCCSPGPSTGCCG